MKQCSKCKQQKDQFRKDASKSDGFDSVCKDCRDLYAAANREKSKLRSAKAEEKRKKARQVKFVNKELTKADITSIRKKAAVVAYAKGYPHLADELASELMIFHARGISKQAGLVLIDILRREYGATRYESNSKRKITIEAQNIDEIDISKSSDGCEELLLDALTAIDRMPNLDARLRQLFILRAKYGLTQTEVAELFCITQFRVSQLENELVKILRDYFDSSHSFTS